MELPTGGPGDHFRKFCPEHAPARHRKREQGPTRPNTVTVNLGTKPTPKGGEMALVEKRAAELMRTASALVLLMGNPGDANVMAEGSEPWAKTVADLSEYEPWIKRLAAGGETSGRLLAWIRLLMATGAIVVPIAIAHGALPDNLAQLAATMFDTGAALQVDASAAA